MEKDNKTSRASQTRSKSERPKVWVPPSSLDAPPAPDGFRYRWIRAESVGFQDTKNITGRIREGYELVRAEAWAAKNPWFGSDRAMTYTAFEIHKDLTEKEGYDPSSDEYYAEVDKRIRVDFPHKFGKNEVKQSAEPVQTVASAKRSVKPGRKTVKLTSSQVAIAKKLGVPLEEYAKQLKNTEGA